jgi:hypothetical protein
LRDIEPGSLPGTRRMPGPPGATHPALISWILLAIAGSVVIWWLTSYLNDLTQLARTDHAAAVALFKSRVLPAFVITVAAGVAGGVLLIRQGLQVVRAREFPPDGMLMMRDTPRTHGRGAAAVGWLLAATGFLLAAVPLAMLGIILWLLRRL